MPICIECRHPVAQLYTSYSRADDSSSGKGVRLTQCPSCRRFADKYVEHDFVVLFLDLVLIKPQVYRHLLFNRLATQGDRFPRTIVRLALLLLLFDVYLTWTRIERSFSGGGSEASDLSAPLPSPPQGSALTYALPLQYLFFLVLCAAETAVFHAPVRFLAAGSVFGARVKDEAGSESVSESTATAAAPKTAVDESHETARADSPRGNPNYRPGQRSSIWPVYPYPNRVSTALLVSSCSKLFPVLMIIWEYDLPSSASALNWAVIISNIAALEILLDCGYLRAAGLVAVGACCRWIVGDSILAAAGLSGYRSDVNTGLLHFAGGLI